MTPSELKYRIEQAGTNPHFFTRKTMKFFGDTMKNYRVRETTIRTRTGASGYSRVYELYRRRPVNGGLKTSAYFDTETLKKVFPVRIEDAFVTAKQNLTRADRAVVALEKYWTEEEFNAKSAATDLIADLFHLLGPALHDCIRMAEIHYTVEETEAQEEQEPTK